MSAAPEVRRALLSVFDKTGLATLGRGLAALGIELVSTGGTARVLAEAGLRVQQVSDVTGFPELLDGRVKTLHPAIHGGILARRNDPEHARQLDRHGIAPIDLVVSNLYPFERTVATQGVAFADAVEQIDVGGVALIRAAAKNQASVAVLVDPSQYAPVLAELMQLSGRLSAETRRRLAREAFRRTAQYDAAIAAWLRTPAPGEPAADELFPPMIVVEAERLAGLRYGENPHQAAAFYRPVGPRFGVGGVGAARQLHGHDLSYNNLLDCSGALGLLLEFDEPAVVVVKHTNPCGAATGPDTLVAFERARASDPVSIYGGIVGANRPVDRRFVQALSGILLEILFAPDFEADALAELRCTKKKLRVLQVPTDRWGWPARPLELRSVLGGLLVQETDRADLDAMVPPRVVSRRPPTEDEWRALRFAWKVVKHTKSNAIVLAAPDRVLGVGAGQMSRVDAARLAVMRAREHGHDGKGAAVASDAFFPFRDGLDVVAEAGATAVIHPGGSIHDDDVVQAADQHGMAMVLTGIRHFKH